MSLKSMLHSSFRRCCRVTSLCSRSASSYVLWGGDDQPISGRPNFAIRFDVGPMSVTISARHRNHIKPT